MALQLVKQLPSMKVVITPARNNDWDTGTSRVVIDTRNSAVVPHRHIFLSSICEAGRPLTEMWADVHIKRARLRLPVEISEVSR